MERAVDIFGHMGLPIDLDPDAQPVGYDDAGFPVFQGKTGQTYTTNMQGNALSGGGQKAGFMDMLAAVPAGMAQSLWDAVETPGNALRGEAVSLGDMWNTAGLVQVGASGAAAPKGSTRMGALRTMADDATEALYHVAPPEYTSGPLRSLFSQMGDDAYEEFAKRWPEAADLGQYHADNVFLFDDLAEAQKYADWKGGNIVQVDPTDLDVQYDMLEVPYGRKKGYPYVSGQIPENALRGYVYGGGQ